MNLTRLSLLLADFLLPATPQEAHAVTLDMVTVFERWEARSATEATMEPPTTKSRNQTAKIPDGR